MTCATIREILVRAEERFGAEDAVRYKKKRNEIEAKTYSQLKKDSESFSCALKALGECGSHIALTGMTSYASKYALSERLVCGECGTLYRRCTWSKRGKKRVVWRCVSRLDYGTKYCHNSPSVDEDQLQRSILAAINSAMSRKSTLIRKITGAMEQVLAPIPGESMSLSDIESRLDELNDLTRTLVAKAAHAENPSIYTVQLKEIMDEAAVLKEKLDISVSMAVSDLGHSVRDIPHLYSEALNIYSYRILWGQKRLITFEDIQKHLQLSRTKMNTLSIKTTY